MKRTILAIALTLFAGSALAAHGKLNVITTTSDLASITREVGGDRVDVTSVARGYQDPHFVEPKPSFLLLLRSADLLEVVGLDLEIGWLPPLIDQSRNAKIRLGAPGYLDLSRGVEILDRPTGAVNRSMGDVHAYGNPHYQLSPANAQRMAELMNQMMSNRMMGQGMMMNQGMMMGNQGTMMQVQPGTMMSLPDRLNWAEQHMTAHMEMLQAIKGPTTQLYVVLSDEQKRIADQLIGPMGMMGMM